MKLTHLINDNIYEEHEKLENICEKNEKKYKFFLDNISNYIYITDRLIFIRESDDYIIGLELGKTNTCTIKLKNENKKFDINVSEGSFVEADNRIEFEYILETDNDKHHIILEIEE